MTSTDDSPERRDPPAASAKRQRIAKLMARAGLCSRREAEAWIVDGRVSVNGEILTTPAVDVDLTDRIVVDGAPLPVAEKTRLFLFHKPRGLVTSDHDPEGRRTVADHLRDNWPDGPRVVTVGRLDINTEGMLLLTNDGGLARVLELPQTGWVRRYRVRAKGTADVGALEALAAGVTLDGIDYAGIEAKLDRVQGANCWLTMGLREGKNREVKRVLEHVGLEVNRLIRLSFGPFQLLDLAEGAVEEVRTRVLRDQLGPALAVQAGVDFGETEPVERPKPAPERAAPPHAAGRHAARQRADVPRDARTRQNRQARPERDNIEAPRPVRERPQAGTRKHVGTLRAARDDAKTAGPRQRIERGDTRDRRDRTIAVERLVSTRAPERPVRRRIRPGDERPDRGETVRRGADGGARQSKESREAPRRRASPSAEAKNLRRSRSGAAPAPMARSRDERPTKPRGKAPSDHARTDRRDEAARGRGPDKPRRAGGSETPSRTPRGDGPAGRRHHERRSEEGRFKEERSREGRAPAGRPGAKDRPDGRRGAGGGKPGARKPARKPSGGRPSGEKPGGRTPSGRTPSGKRPGRNGPPRGPSRPKR